MVLWIGMIQTVSDALALLFIKRNNKKENEKNETRHVYVVVTKYRVQCAYWCIVCSVVFR